ncbi:uncharacterized protein [Aegilops tauschii subsp. strangulata]|uniref:DUF6598 domain-containing protein n=2 Tax=Aegilops tauschii subsp. strangulata TaxID=200361 RepID=A0A453SSR3_AEGTS|nr:uncharacterized protein LOC109784196 [Aegilops tauschii subsp. strangulata]
MVRRLSKSENLIRLPILHTGTPPPLPPPRAQMPVPRQIFRLLRRPGVAVSHDPPCRLSSTSRPLLSFMASAPPCWSPPPLARRPFPLMMVPDLPVRRVSRFPPGSRSMTSGTTLQDMNTIAGKHDASSNIVDISGCDENGRSATNRRSALVASDGEEDDVLDLGVLPKSRHRDGSLYRNTHSWKRFYNVDDRSETRLPDPTDCDISNGECIRHQPNRVLQIFSLKLAELVDLGPVELYGYIAVRDGLDTLRNYVVNISRDDPIIVKQGSLIGMAGPKREIDLISTILVEYDMRIKVGEEERDDYQLIDGVTDIDDQDLRNCALKCRIQGDCGAVDLTIARVDNAVMANIEVAVSEVQSSFDLRLRCFIGGYNEGIRLFKGTIGESRHLKRSVVAVKNGSTLVLKFKVASKSSDSVEDCCPFMAGTHGLDTRQIKTGFGLISVKVTWSTLP